MDKARIITMIIVVVLAASGGVGAFFLLNNSSDPADVEEEKITVRTEPLFPTTTDLYDREDSEEIVDNSRFFLA